MAKKKVVESPVEQPKDNKADLIKQLLAEREISCEQDKMAIDKKLAEITMGE